MSLNEQRAVANVRERKRTQKLNQAYKQLQSIIPKEPSDKMSKIHTLKLTLAYIDFLNNILKESEPGSEFNLPEGELDETKAKSPYLTSPSSSYACMSATSEEEEEYQHKSKRLKVDMRHLNESQDSSYTVHQDNSCYATVCNHITAKSNYYTNCAAGSSDISSPDNIPYTNQTQISDDLTISLRNAFREYRSGKRKRHL